MANVETSGAADAVQPFPKAFWTANVTELFERAAYYSMASFVVIYLGKLGFGAYWPSFLNSTVLWGLVYFLPILSGTIADQIGFRRALLGAFVLLAIGYFFMGYPIWLGGSVLADTIKPDVAVGSRDAIMVVSAIVLIGIGGSVIKPCISGTVQKVAGTRATLGFAIFYMVINIGSLFGRGTAFVVRSGSGLGTVLAVITLCALAAFGIVAIVYRTTKAERSRTDIAIATAGFTAIVAVAAALIYLIFSATAGERAGTTNASLSYIFAVAAAASVVAFFVVMFTYREPEAEANAAPKVRRSIGRILLDMVVVLRSGRFTLYLIVMTGFYFLYNQVYNVFPLYLQKVVETKPAMDLYTAANPFVIVCFQLIISRVFGRMKPIRSMVAGTVVIAVAMAINVAPIYSAGGIRAVGAHWLPLASMFFIITVALVALGELFTSPRMYEYIGALAPKGQEGLFLGYANLPLAFGAILSGPFGAYIFNEIMIKGATRRPDGLLELVPANNAAGWLILMAIGFVSAASLWVFNRWIEKQTTATA
jgi:proton-dependent oligopeptide transporter, POT family